MKATFRSLAALILLATLSGVAGAQQPAGGGSSAPRPEDFGARYGILTDKNIFVRNRPPTRRGSTPSRGSSPRRPEESMVLTGVAIQEGRHVAFIEDTARRSTQRLVTGDAVLGGKVAGIDFNGLEFEPGGGGQRAHIAVGRNFLGAVATAAPPPATASTTGPSPSTAPAGSGTGAAAPPPAADDANLSVLERLKRARERSMGK
jgi:hypothetical protein